MNKTKIEWTGFTWNPVTGCWGPGGTAEKPNRCVYCYAVGVAKRFYATPGDMVNCGDPFAPTFHPDRLSQPSKVKKPSKIFVCSMADLFGDWVPSEWIKFVFDVVSTNPQHTFQFLTKSPRRLVAWNPAWAALKNAWVGTTVTNQADADERLPWLLQVDALVRFVSHEPLLGAIKIRHGQGLFPTKTYTRSGQFGQDLMITKTPALSWAIIGAMTGPGAVKPKPEWVQGLVDQYRAAGVPCFVKDSLYEDFPVREWPNPAPIDAEAAKKFERVGGKE